MDAPARCRVLWRPRGAISPLPRTDAAGAEVECRRTTRSASRTRSSNGFPAGALYDCKIARFKDLEVACREGSRATGRGLRQGQEGGRVLGEHLRHSQGRRGPRPSSWRSGGATERGAAGRRQAALDGHRGASMAEMHFRLDKGGAQYRGNVQRWGGDASGCAGVEINLVRVAAMAQVIVVAAADRQGHGVRRQGGVRRDPLRHRQGDDQGREPAPTLAEMAKLAEGQRRDQGPHHRPPRHAGRSRPQPEALARSRGERPGGAQVGEREYGD